MESNLVVMKRFTLQAQLNLQEKHEALGGGLGDLVLAGRKQRNDAEEEDPNDCCGRMMMMMPASIPAFVPYTHPEVPASSVSPIGLVGPVAGNGINKKTEAITQMTKMLCLNTRGGYYQQSYRLQSTTVTNTTGSTTTKVTTELNSSAIHGFEKDDHHHPHHLLHHRHHPNEHHHSGSTSSNSSVSSVSFYSSEDADVLSSAPTTPVNEKVQMNFPTIFTSNEEEEKAELESKSILPVTKINAITSANAIPVLPSTRIPPRPTVEEITDDELNTKESLQVWHDIKEDDDGALGDDDDSEESDEEELEDETDSGEEDDDEEEDDSDDEEEIWETEDEEGVHHHVQVTEVSEISMGGFVFGYSDGEEEEESDSEDDSEFDEEDEDDEEDCANDGLFGYDSADDSDDEENSDEEEAEEQIDQKFPILEELPCPMRRINSHRQFDRPPLRPCLSTVSMKREDSNCSSNSGSRVRFSETAERPQIIKTTHFRYSYYEFEAHLKSNECDSELKSTFGDSRTEMEKFQEINFLRESYISLLDDDDAARERENPSNSIVGKVEHILLSKAMESRGEDCQLEDIGLGFGNKSNFCMDALFALIGGKIKLSDIQKEQHAKGDQAPPCTPVVSPDASGDEWETEADEDEEE